MGLAPELRRIAHRAVGVAPDPDHMGQGIMRAPDLHDVPDPLRSSLRNLVAVAGGGGRYAFIPAAISFTTDSVGHRVDVSLVLADVRLGSVLWRTVTYASGTTPAQALVHAMEAAFPGVVAVTYYATLIPATASAPRSPRRRGVLRPPGSSLEWTSNWRA